MSSEQMNDLDVLKTHLSEKEFRTWIAPLSVNHKGKLYTIYAPNQFFLDWIKMNYKQTIIEGVQTQVGQSDLIIEFSVAGSENNYKSPSKTTRQNPEVNHHNTLATQGPQIDLFSNKAGIVVNEQKVNHSEYENKSLNEKQQESHTQKSGYSKTSQDYQEQELYGFDQALALPRSASQVQFGMSIQRQFTFENFVEGKSNQVAKAASIQVASNPSSYHNPLFVYGGSGLGKTHLMHAIGNAVLDQSPSANILYVSSEKFVRDMVDALRLHAMDHFQDCYRAVDMLLIDDIQFIAGKGRSQEEFFHTFNTLLNNGKQIVLSCDRYPKDIEGIEDRLKSRFGHGLTVTIDLPDLETRVAILMSKARLYGITLPHDIAFYIAKHIQSNVRELEGALKRVITSAQVTKRALTTSFVAETLKDVISIQNKLVKVENIQKVVAKYYNIKMRDLISKRKKRDIARPRQMAMALAKALTDHSFPEIGQHFGGRDHTTIMYAVKTIDHLKQNNFELNDDYQTLYRKLSS